MKDEMKFHKMTRPMKFRKFKLFLKSVGRTYEVGTYRIKYLINYILYKLNYLNKYSYRTKGNETDTFKETKRGGFVTTPVIRAEVIMNIFEEEYIDLEYYYKLKKDGSKKITFVLKDYTFISVKFESYLKNIFISIPDGKTYSAEGDLPVFKVLLPVHINTHSGAEDVSKLNTCTKVIDISPIKSLKLGHVISDKMFQEINLDVKDFYYNTSIGIFEDKLKEFKLDDLMREV